MSGESHAEQAWHVRRRIREATAATTDLIAAGVQLRTMEAVADRLEEAEGLATEAMNAQAGAELDRRLASAGAHGE